MPRDYDLTFAEAIEAQHVEVSSLDNDETINEDRLKLLANRMWVELNMYGAYIDLPPRVWACIGLFARYLDIIGVTSTTMELTAGLDSELDRLNWPERDLFNCSNMLGRARADYHFAAIEAADDDGPFRVLQVSHALGNLSVVDRSDQSTANGDSNGSNPEEGQSGQQAPNGVINGDHSRDDQSPVVRQHQRRVLDAERTGTVQPTNTPANEEQQIGLPGSGARYAGRWYLSRPNSNGTNETGSNGTQ